MMSAGACDWRTAAPACALLLLVLLVAGPQQVRHSACTNGRLPSVSVQDRPRGMLMAEDVQRWMHHVRVCMLRSFHAESAHAITRRVIWHITRRVISTCHHTV